MDTKELIQSIKTYGKQKVMLYKDLERIQKYVADSRKNGKTVNIIAPQKGFQEKFLMLANIVDIVILSGNRGGGKTWVLSLAEAERVTREGYTCLILRRNKEDGAKKGGINDIFQSMYAEIGEYIDSKKLFRIGKSNECYFTYFGDGLKDSEESRNAFISRLVGGNITTTIMDECSQSSEFVFNHLQTILRSAYGMKTHFLGACNPNPNNLLFTYLVDWWTDSETGCMDPAKSGKVRYFYQYGGSICESYWGSSYKEVWEQAKYDINERFGRKKVIDESNYKDYIRSITFIDSDLADNAILNDSDPSYQGKLVGDVQSMAINILGSWKKTGSSQEWITYNMMENFFNNNPQRGDGFKCATLDIAYGLAGGRSDYSVIAAWDGFHLFDLDFTNKQMTTAEYLKWIKSFLSKNSIPINRLAYDGSGCPSMQSDIPEASPVLRAVVKGRSVNGRDSSDFFYDLKSQMAFELVRMLDGSYNGSNICGISIEPSILEKEYGNITVREAFMRQRRAIKKDEERSNNLGKFVIIKKKDMKSLVGGGTSPDLLEGTILYRMFWALNKPVNKLKQSTLSRLRLF